MITLLLGIIIFLQLIEYLVLADVILSWLTLIGLKLRPRFIAQILDPLYTQVKKYIPTQIGPFEFTPIVVILLCFFLRGVIMIFFPDVNTYIGDILPR